MRKFLCTLMLVGIGSLASAQVADYSFSQASNTFDTLTVGKSLTPSIAATGIYYVDSTVIAGSAATTTGIGLPIGFTFKYNGSNFDLFGLNANGWISFGQSSLAPNSVNMNSSASNTPISATSTASAVLQNRVSALGRNLAGQANSRLTYTTLGTAPNRILVVEWLHYRRTTTMTGEDINFQIRIHETTNVVEFIYGTVVLSTNPATAPQVGMRGTANTDFNNRTSTTDWAATTAGIVNTASISISNVIFPALGLTYIWTPPLADDAGITAINSPGATITSGSQDIAVTLKNFGLDTLFNTTIAWSVNGAIQTPFSWSDTLIHNASQGPDTIGTFNFTTEGNNIIKAWTEIPNGVADGNNTNDTTIYTVFVIPANDLAAIAWITPVSGCGHTASDSVTIQITNVGTAAQSNIPVYYSIDGGTTYVGPETIAGPVNPGDTVMYTFTQHADFSAAGIYNCIAYVNNTGDANFTNDTVKTIINVLGTLAGNPIIDSLENGNIYYIISNNTNSAASLSGGVGNLGTFGFQMTGGSAAGTWPAGSSTTTTGPQAFSYSDHVASVATCDVDATAFPANDLYLSFDLRENYYTGAKYTYFMVLVNGTDTLSDINGIKFFNPVTANSDPFAKKVFDLSSYAGQNFVISLMSSCKYNSTYNGNGVGNNVFVDNIALTTKPVIDLGPDTAFCPGSSVVIDAGASPAYYTYSYSWSTILHPASIATTQTIAADSIASYIAVVNNGYGVTASDTVLVSQFSAPVVSLGPDPTNCLSFILDPGAGYTSYNWSTSATSQFITVTSSGYYWVDVTNNHGCVARDSAFVTILPGPTVHAGPDQSFCYIDTLFIISATASDYDSLLWVSSGDGHFNDSTLLNPYYVPGTTDISNGFVNLSLTGYNGCDTISDTTHITITTTATANAGTDETICLGGSVQLNATGGTTYAWSPSAGLSDPNIGNPIANPTTTTTYIVTVTSHCGSATDNIVVTVNSITPPDLGNDTAICAGNTLTLDAGTYDSYSWSTSETTQTIDVTTAGTFIVTVTGSNTCTASDSVHVLVHPLPVIHVSNDTALCGTQFTIVADTGYTNYLWNGTIAGTNQYVATMAGDYFVNATDSNGCSNNSDTMHLQLNLSYAITNSPNICQGQSYFAGGALQTTTGTYYDSLFTIHGCDSIVTTNLTVHPLPIVDLPPDTLTCNGQYVLDAGVGFTTYLWNDTAAGTHLYNVTVPGDYWVYVTDAFGCSNYSDTTNVTFYNIPPIVLPDTTISLYNGSVLLDAGLGYASYHWSDGQTTHLIVVFGNYLGLGTHHIYVTVTTYDGCTAVGEAIITVIDDAGISQYDNPSVSIYPNPAENVLYIAGLNADGEMNVQITDAIGRIIVSSSCNNQMTPYLINISALSPGIYTIRIIGENNLITRKFIKR